MDFCPMDLEKGRKRKKEDDDEYNPSIGIIHDKNLIRESSKVPVIAKRADMVYSLIEAYDLLRNMTVLKSTPATDWDLKSVHSSDFLEYMKSINDLYTVDDDADFEYGLGYDCPPLPGIYDYICSIAGSSLSAAKALIRGDVEIVINWCGGWHHAKRDLVEGFCYTNDIVLAIMELKNVFSHILYIDLDAHHGNGVEDSFAFSDKVFTLSLHIYEAGFYPGTGTLADVGQGRGAYHCINVPLREGIRDEQYTFVFENVVQSVLKRFSPDAVVVQCGADGLAGDSLGGFNLTSGAYEFCLNKIMELRKPTLVLGGGGYNLPNTARCWTRLTSTLIGCHISNDIPEHEYFLEYGPSFELEINPTNRKDLNTPEALNNIVRSIEDTCSLIQA